MRWMGQQFELRNMQFQHWTHHQLVTRDNQLIDCKRTRKPVPKFSCERVKVLCVLVYLRTIVNPCNFISRLSTKNFSICFFQIFWRKRHFWAFISFNVTVTSFEISKSLTNFCFRLGRVVHNNLASEGMKLKHGTNTPRSIKNPMLKKLLSSAHTHAHHK